MYQKNVLKYFNRLLKININKYDSTVYYLYILFHTTVYVTHDLPCIYEYISSDLIPVGASKNQSRIDNIDFYTALSAKTGFQPES